ncbi:protease modulator HflC [Comamonas serinivorans]|uniref:Protein HflC n=1 Tax=Comamonas serinivorans TaxID=1082851 RepID=A0A1Y0ENF9_9BURK|nr:protease modulator HflC [Comamonas serinivorans]ARU04849.1 protease modulator HflC [Comamonas serinivorans]
MNKLGSLAAVVVLALVVFLTSAFVVDQRQFGLVYQFGQIQKVISSPGLHWKVPFVQSVSHLDKRLLTLESQDTEAPMLTAEKQRIVIDWYVRWRITDPRAYVQNVGRTIVDGELQLTRTVRNAFQEEINRHTVKELISTKRDQVMADVKRAVNAAISQGQKPWGVEVVDVRMTRADYAESIIDSVYQRMATDRERVANALRSAGAAEGEKIRADADRQREVLLANAYRDAQKIKGEGDAAANSVYAEVFGQDPQFAQFYRNLRAYTESFDKKSDVMVIDPQSNEFFKAMRSGMAPR